jgi:hypothetical protein
MTRRELIALLGTTAATWPVGVRTQQAERGLKHLATENVPTNRAVAL